VASLADRPGLGRAVSINGAACVVPRGAIVVETGYRNQVTTAGGTSTLSTAFVPVVRYGIAGQNEIIVSPSLIFSRRTGANLGGTFVPASGMQDAGIGAKHLFRDRPWAQDALELFATVASGYPTGPFGFSAGAPTYLLGYSIAVPLTDRFGASTTQNIVSSAGINGAGLPQRYVAYQPSVGVSYALSALTTVLLQHQVTTPTAPGAGTGNRALVGIQRTLSSNVVVDVEFEMNLLPAPGFNQHALGAGIVVRL
jgi:hypothetical protein